MSMKKSWKILLLMLVGAVAGGVALWLIAQNREHKTFAEVQAVSEAPAPQAPQSETIKPDSMTQKTQYALIETEKGTMKAELYTQETPGTVQNFVDLANHNFYDGLTFHRVIPDFVIQGGCPRGDGTGGPGYRIKCETSAPRQYHDRGVLSMAHAGKDTGGSQFFICHCRENTQHLDGRHTCFGKVVEGLEVIDDIRQGDRILSIRIVEE